MSITGITEHYSLYHLPERESGLHICIFKNDLTLNIPFTQLFILQLHFRYVYILILEHPELFPLTNKKCHLWERTWKHTQILIIHLMAKMHSRVGLGTDVKYSKTREQWFLLPDFVSVNENVWAWDLYSLRLSSLFSSCNKKYLQYSKISYGSKTVIEPN